MEIITKNELMQVSPGTVLIDTRIYGLFPIPYSGGFDIHTITKND